MRFVGRQPNQIREFRTRTAHFEPTSKIDQRRDDHDPRVAERRAETSEANAVDSIDFHLLVAADFKPAKWKPLDSMIHWEAW
jgi:hypothetical protein